MILKSLNIELQGWGEDKGKHTGAIKFSGRDGEVSLRLDDKHCHEIFKVCSKAILENAREAASCLEKGIIEQSTLLIED